MINDSKQFTRKDPMSGPWWVLNLVVLGDSPVVDKVYIKTYLLWNFPENHIGTAQRYVCVWMSSVYWAQNQSSFSTKCRWWVMLSQANSIIQKILIPFPSPLSLPFVPLSPAVSKAKILGNHELIVKSGSDINLTCVASQISNPPSFIYWYKGGRVINYSQRGGINVQTDRNTKTSKLLIAKATYGKFSVWISKKWRILTKSVSLSLFFNSLLIGKWKMFACWKIGDSGNYTCAPSNSGESNNVVR